MAIKGLKELLEKHGKEPLTAEQFEDELNKILPETHIPKNVYNELNEKYKMLDKQKKDTDTLLAEANGKLKDSTEFEGKYKALLSQQKEDSEKYERQIADMKRGYAIDSALSKAGARNAKAVKALLDESKITLGADGSFIGIDEQIMSIKKDNDFLFASTDSGKRPSFGGDGGGRDSAGDSFAKSISQAMGVSD